LGIGQPNCGKIDPVEQKLCMIAYNLRCLLYHVYIQTHIRMMA